MNERRVARFESDTPEYTAAFHTFLSHTDQKERALAWIDREVSALTRRGIAIDAGAGTGKLTAWLADRFETVIGIEPSDSLAAEFRSARPGTRLIEQTILDANPEAAADFVLCSHVFYYLPPETWDANLLRLMSWLAPGGVLAVAIQNPDTDCMRMAQHFGGNRFSLRELIPTAESAPGGPWRVRLDTVAARVRAGDPDTACRIAEFVLNSPPVPRAPSWEDLERYVRTRFARPDGTFEMSCDQDFLRIER